MLHGAGVRIFRNVPEDLYGPLLTTIHRDLTSPPTLHPNVLLSMICGASGKAAASMAEGDLLGAEALVKGQVICAIQALWEIQRRQREI